jgi:hypothetical protein
VFLRYSTESHARPSLITSFWESRLARALAGTLLGLSVLYVVLRRLRGRRGPHPPEEVFAFRCRRCGGSVGFRASQAGTKGNCPVCKTVCSYPPPTPARSASDATGMGRWAKAMRKLPRRRKGPA